MGKDDIESFGASPKSVSLPVLLSVSSAISTCFRFGLKLKITSGRLQESFEGLNESGIERMVRRSISGRACHRPINNPLRVNHEGSSFGSKFSSPVQKAVSQLSDGTDLHSRDERGIVVFTFFCDLRL
jgi:hypothetical protein